LTVHQLDSYNVKRVLREVEGEVPVPHFGVILDENEFLRAAARLKQAGWCFVILHTNASGDKA
jgi:extradiol dioxygenase family protein